MYFNTVMCWMKHPYLSPLLPQALKFRTTLNNSLWIMVWHSYIHVHIWTDTQFFHFLNYHVITLSSIANHNKLQWNQSTLATFGSIQSCPTYTGGQLTEITWHYKNNCSLSFMQNVQFTMKRQVVELESKYRFLSMNREFKYSNQLSLEYSNVLSILVDKA